MGVEEVSDFIDALEAEVQMLNKEADALSRVASARRSDEDAESVERRRRLGAPQR